MGLFLGPPPLPTLVLEKEGDSDVDLGTVLSSEEGEVPCGQNVTVNEGSPIVDNLIYFSAGQPQLWILPFLKPVSASLSVYESAKVHFTLVQVVLCLILNIRQV